MTKLIERTVTRKINNQPVACFERRDGVQRREFVGHDAETGNACYGVVSKDKWSKAVWAYRMGGDRAFWSTHNATTEQAFAKARHWLLTGEA